MSLDKLINFMSIAEKLKCNTRHSWTSSNRHESVAEHSWRLCLLAYSLNQEMKEYDMDKVMLMCLVHDLGESIIGDIPAFDKNESDEENEKDAIKSIIDMVDVDLKIELSSIFKEIDEQKTKESRIFKALDKMEAVLQHNEAPLETWIELEYELNLVYGVKEAEEFPFLKKLRNRLKIMSEEKIKNSNNNI